MPSVTDVRLTGHSIDNDTAKLRIQFRSEFTARERAARSAFVYDLYIDNAPETPDLDNRRRRVGSAFAVASGDPFQGDVSFTVDRKFLDEDWKDPITGIGDTTDEWLAEVVAKPFVPGTKKGSSERALAKEFGWQQPTD
jgi:hypothetical protein